MSILITGATGNIGGHVLAQSLAKGLPVRALVRNPQTASLPPQVEVVAGDLTRPETLDRCLDGIDTVFLVWVAPAEAAASALERIAKARPPDRPAFSAAQNRPSLVPAAKSFPRSRRAGRATDRGIRTRMDVPAARHVRLQRSRLVGPADTSGRDRTLAVPPGPDRANRSARHRCRRGTHAL